MSNDDECRSMTNAAADILRSARVRRWHFLAILAFVLLDLSFVVFPLRPPLRSPISFIRFSLVTCQMSLLTVWIALSGQQLLRRLLLATPVFVWFGWFLAADAGAHSRNGSSVIFAILAQFVIGAIVPYGIVQFFGVRCLWRKGASDWQAVRLRRRPIQFSIAALFKYTFVVASAAAAIRVLQPSVRDNLQEALVGILIISLLGLAGIWAVLALNGGFVRVGLLTAAAILCGLGLAYAMQNGAMPGILCTWVGVHLAMLLGVLACYRFFGYRATRGELVAAIVADNGLRTRSDTPA